MSEVRLVSCNRGRDHTPAILKKIDPGDRQRSVLTVEVVEGPSDPRCFIH